MKIQAKFWYYWKALHKWDFLKAIFVNFTPKAWKILDWTNFSHEKVI